MPTDDATETVDTLLAAVARIPPTDTPTKIGRYEFVRLLGAGGMGRVYEARDPELARRVAIKVLHERETPDTRANHLRREAQTLARLTHPNVIAVHDVGIHDGELYIVMQLVEGVTLERHLEGKRAPEIVAAFVEAGRGLVAAHAEGIVHRDFKPGNVLVGRDGSIRVSDFGIAHGGTRSGDPDAAIELETASPIGTPAYMSPEQHAGGDVTPASDQFAFCVALWEALQGERPFPGSTMAELAAAVAAARRRDPKRPMPRGVRAALIRGLSPRPEDRFASMTELLAELTPPRRTMVYAAIAGGALAVGAFAFVLLRSDPDPCAALSRRDWLPTLIAAAVRGNIDDVRAVGELVQRWPAARETTCRTDRVTQASCLDAVVGELERALATPVWGSERWGPIRTPLPAIERCSDNPTGPPRVTPIASRHIVGDPPTGLALGRDGRIAIVTPRRLEVLLASGAQESSVSSPHLDPAELYRWNADGVLWFKQASSIELIDPANGATRNTFGLPGGTLAISRDGKRALTAEAEWSIVEIRERAATRITGGLFRHGREPARRLGGAGGAAEWSPDDRRIAAIATVRRGATSEHWLRIVDARTNVAVDSPIRLDHDIVQASKLVWLDPTRVVVDGRASPGSGEGLWIVRLDDAGRAVAWEERLPAGPGTAYRIIGFQPPRALAEQLTTSDKLIRIQITDARTREPGPADPAEPRVRPAPPPEPPRRKRNLDSEVSVISQTISALPHGGVELSADGARALIAVGRGRGWLDLGTGAFTPLAIPGTGRIAIDPEGRVLSIADDRLIATSDGDTALGPVPAASHVRCSAGGCVTYRVTDRQTIVRQPDGSMRAFPVDATDLAISRDAKLVAIAGRQDSIVIGDLKTGTHRQITTSTYTCGAARFVEHVAWYGDVLYAAVFCGEGTSRIVRIAHDDAMGIYEGPWIGNLAVTPSGDVIAIRRIIESQAVSIEGL